MSLELVGTLKVINEKIQVTDSFAKMEFVIDVKDGGYSNLVAFELVNKRCDSINYHNLGDNVKVFFNVRSNEYNGKYFTNLNAWRIEKAEQEAPIPPPTAPVDNDLPF